MNFKGSLRWLGLAKEPNLCDFPERAGAAATGACVLQHTRSIGTIAAFSCASRRRRMTSRWFPLNVLSVAGCSQQHSHTKRAPLAHSAKTAAASAANCQETAAALGCRILRNGSRGGDCRGHCCGEHPTFRRLRPPPSLPRAATGTAGLIRDPASASQPPRLLHRRCQNTYR